MTRRKRLVIAVLVGIGALLVSAIPVPGFDLLMLPGLLASSIFWPEGIHSSHFTGPVGMVVMIAIIVLGTAGFWGAVVYAVMKRRQS